MKFKLNIISYKYLILGSTAAIAQNDQCQIAYEIRKGRFIMIFNSHDGGMAFARPYGFEIDFVRDPISGSAA